MFFSKLAKLPLSQMTLGISFSADNDKITLSVLPKVKVKDKVVNSLKPLNITGTPEELDREFFNVLVKPMENTNELFTNITTFEESVERAKNKSDYAKKEKEKITTKVNKLTQLLKSSEFDAAKDYEKAIKLANEILKIEATNKEALKVIQDMKQHQTKTLF